MKQLILLSVLILAACVHTDQPAARSAASLDKAMTFSDWELCEDFGAEGQPGKHTLDAITKRKINCQAVYKAELRRVLASAPSAGVCQVDLERPSPESRAEVKKRGINCDRVLANHYQQQQIAAQQDAAAAQDRAARAAIVNAFKPAPIQNTHQPYVMQPLPAYRAPIQTTCNRGLAGSVNCTTY